MSLRFAVFCECGISIWGSFVLLVCALSQTQAQANTVGQVLSQDSSWYSPWSTNILQWITRVDAAVLLFLIEISRPIDSGTVKIFQGKPAQETGDPALGDDCWSSERCQVRTRNSECTEGRCTCKLDYIPDATLRNCIYKNVIGRICGSDADCSQYNSAICSGETCICGLNFINAPSASACLPVSSIGGKCAVDEQCWRVTNLSICDNPTMLCSCPVRYVNDANGKTCLPGDTYQDTYSAKERSPNELVATFEVKRLDEPCVISDQCLATSPDSTCLKNADALGLGEDCVTGDLCQARVTGSTCDAGSKKCVCEANNYVQFRIPNQTLDTCIPG
ncbi:unnamed protein product [Notodromas monacha]|uniref:EB domain-containing protein n=1 Tax=Notodromas monacha TaxID=399045 RepID=A0A7R9GHA9_9CRUS|nr:unnamed protein product [Notodromas monacha]CAG0922685.1 unnamed protein product [Notodromas monacha]